MTRTALIAALSILVGCTSADPSGTGFSSVDRGDAEGVVAEDPTDDTAVPADDDEDTTDDTTSPLEPSGWDSAPPSEIEDGWILEGTVVCGLLDRAAPKQWLKDGDVWTELPFDFSPRMLPGIEHCGSNSPKLLRWTDDSMYIEAAGMAHWLYPSDTPDVWAGTVEPLGESSPECDAALASHGLSWPVHLSFTVTGLVSPTEVPTT
jgi:hypothetical protein